MIENEQSKKVTDEELLRDIENTKKEIHAYSNLWTGYEALSELPELDDATRRMYAFRARANYGLKTDCEKFLTKLSELRDERGI